MLDPPAPKVTEMNSGLSSASLRMASRRLPSSAGSLGGYTSNETFKPETFQKIASRGSEAGVTQYYSARYSIGMELVVANHPLISHKVTLLRDKNTPSALFRQLVEELVTLLTFEATKDLRVDQITVETPLTKTQGFHLSKPTPLIIPILRAGLGMLAGITRLIPDAEVGFLGIKRNEETLQPVTYANRLPDRLDNREVFLIDPMLATGGTLIDSLDYAFERGATKATCICLLGAPEGVEALRQHLAAKWPAKHVSIHLAALDEKLNEVGYIVPGLGDAGDRLYGNSGGN